MHYSCKPFIFNLLCPFFGPASIVYCACKKAILSAFSHVTGRCLGPDGGQAQNSLTHGWTPLGLRGSVRAWVVMTVTAVEIEKPWKADAQKTASSSSRPSRTLEPLCWFSDFLGSVRPHAAGLPAPRLCNQDNRGVGRPDHPRQGAPGYSLVPEVDGGDPV